MGFKVEQVKAVPSVKRIARRRFEDDRGWFEETYKASDFESFGLPATFPQDNAAYNAQHGVLRGLHFQRHPADQGKLVRCVVGRVWDVAADIRPDSDTFRRWHGQELSADDGTMLWIPPGFAHGYVTLTEESIVEYKVTHEYAPDLDTSLRWNDPDLGIDWPVHDPILSPKDAAAPTLADLRDKGHLPAKGNSP